MIYQLIFYAGEFESRSLIRPQNFLLEMLNYKVINIINLEKRDTKL